MGPMLRLVGRKGRKAMGLAPRLTKEGLTIRGVAQLAARLVRDQEVPGSSPGAPTLFSRRVSLVLATTLVMAVPALAIRPVPIPERQFSGLSEAGPTGLILVPTGDTLHSGAFAFGLHRGVTKLATAYWGVEAGLRSPDLYDNPNVEDWNDATVFFTKLTVSGLIRRFLGGGPERLWAPSLAAGAEDSLRHLFTATLSLGRGRTAAGEADPRTYYGVASWAFRLGSWPLEATGGLGNGRFASHVFGGLSIIPASLFGSTLKFVGEYAGRQADAGARIALSRNLRLDFGFLLKAWPEPGTAGRHWAVSIDRGLVGASQTGMVRLNLLWSRPKGDPPRG